MAIEILSIVGLGFLFSQLESLWPTNSSQGPIEALNNFSQMMFSLPLGISLTGTDVIIWISGFFALMALVAFGISTLFSFADDAPEGRLSAYARRVVVFGSIGLAFAGIISQVASVAVYVMMALGLLLQLFSAWKVGYGNSRIGVAPSIVHYLSGLILLTLVISSLRESYGYATLALYPLLAVGATSFLGDLIRRYWKMGYLFWSNIEAALGMIFFLAVWSIIMAVVFPFLFPQFGIALQLATAMLWAAGYLWRGINPDMTRE